jgi:Holliday junction resolvase RusA-like endonuclease
MFRIVVPGVMRGKQRPRATRQGRVYTPAQTVTAEAFVRACAVQQVGQPCIIGPVSLGMLIEVAVPQSWPKKKQAAALGGTVSPTGKPDLDNSLKLCCDALNGVMWLDDSQVVEAIVRKRYGEKPQTTLSITPGPE